MVGGLQSIKTCVSFLNGQRVHEFGVPECGSRLFEQNPTSRPTGSPTGRPTAALRGSPCSSSPNRAGMTYTGACGKKGSKSHEYNSEPKHGRHYGKCLIKLDGSRPDKGNCPTMALCCPIQYCEGSTKYIASCKTRAKQLRAKNPAGSPAWT